MDHVRQGKQKLSPTHQFPERDKTRSKPINKKDHFFPRTDLSLFQHFVWKRNTESWEEIKEGSEGGKENATVPHPPFFFPGH